MATRHAHIGIRKRERRSRRALGDWKRRSTGKARRWVVAARRHRVPIGVGCAFALVVIVLSALAWLVPISGPGTFARNQWLIHTIEQEQRPDGLFVFSTQVTYPPVIAETYFAVVSLHELGVGIPRQAALSTSLTELEVQGDSALAQGNPTLDSRDLYELLMIHRLAGIPLDTSRFSGYAAAMQKLTETQAPPATLLGLHNWYYAIQTLHLLGLTSDSVRGAVAREVPSLIHQLSAPSTMVIQIAYVVDACAILGIRLTPDERAVADAQVQRAWTAQGGFASAASTPDVMSSFFALVIARELGISEVDHVQAISEWVARLRTWTGYSEAVGLAVDPLGTMYALALNHLLLDANGDTAVR